MSAFDYSTTAGSNTTIAGVSVAEGMAPGNVNDAMRGMAADIAKLIEDTSGANTTGGSSNAYTLTTSSTLTAYADGTAFLFLANHDNTGAATLNVDSLGAKNLRIYDQGGDRACTSGDIKSGGAYLVIYDASLGSGSFIILNPAARETQNVYDVESFGADGTGTSDSRAAFVTALAFVATTGGTLRAKNKYLLNSTLVFPNGTYGFEMAEARELGTSPNVGFIWNGGNSDVMVEINEVKRSHFRSLIVSNADQQSTGITGILMHSPTSTVAASNQNVFDFIGIYGCNVGLQIGDYTTDTYDSNFDDNEFRNIHCYDVANPLIIDSNNQDNILIGRFHNGGPQTLSAHVGTRAHIIYVKRGGNGFKVENGFARCDGITADNAAIRIDDNGFSCDYFSFEGNSVTCRLLDIGNGSTSISRDQSVIQKMIAPETVVDSSGRQAIIGARSGTTLIGCSWEGDVECQRPVVALGCVFGSSAAMTTSGSSGEFLNIGAMIRPDPASALTADEFRVNVGKAKMTQDALFESAVLNSTGTANQDVITVTDMNADSLHIWTIFAESSTAAIRMDRLVIHRDGSGTITADHITDFEASAQTTYTVTDNGSGSYTINIANSAAVNYQYAGWAERKKFTF